MWELLQIKVLQLNPKNVGTNTFNKNRTFKMETKSILNVSPIVSKFITFLLV